MLKIAITGRPRLWRVTAPHACAGFITTAGGTIYDAAPILRWMIGRTIEEVSGYCERRRWVLEEVIDGPRPGGPRAP